MTEKPNLLTIPPELRLQIYDLILTPPTPLPTSANADLLSHVNGFIRAPRPGRKNGVVTIPPLLHTSRLLRHETFPVVLKAVGDLHLDFCYAAAVQSEDAWSILAENLSWILCNAVMEKAQKLQKARDLIFAMREFLRSRY